MRKFIIAILTILLLTGCAVNTYSTITDNPNYYTVMVYEGDVLVESYSPCRIIARNGLTAGYRTSVVLDIQGAVITVIGSTILLYPIGYPDRIYMLYNRSFYRWNDRFNHFIYRPSPPRPPRRHELPREPRRNEPRPQPRNQVQPRNESRPSQQPSSRPQEQPRQNNSQPIVVRPNNQQTPRTNQSNSNRGRGR